MEKILVVEDNKALSKLITAKIHKELEFEVDIAHSMKDAMDKIAKNTYFVALLDLNLPDAPDGEVIDATLKQGIPSIVLTGNNDEQTRKEILKKDIVDYVFKGNVEDVNYIIHTIDRVHKNKRHKVLIVEDSMTFRSKMKALLESQHFQVLAAAHGEEALNLLEWHPDIKLVLTDYIMPVIDGLELTKQIRKKYSKNELNVIAVSSNDDESVSAKFLKSGASDFIHKPFSKEEFTCRVNNSIEALENIERISKMVNTDVLTGAFNRRYFFNEGQAQLEAARDSGDTLAVALFDTDHLKKINDTFGHDAGDMVLKRLADTIANYTKRSDIVARIGGNEFALVLNANKEEAVKAMVRLCHEIADTKIVHNDKKISFTVSIGLCTELEDNIDEMVNQADMALYHAQNNGRNRVELAD